MHAHRASGKCRPAFSLIELTTVVFIIVIVVALTLPALRGGRDAARRVATQGLIEQVSTAVSRFQRDNAGRPPGLFTPRQMGRDVNGGGPAVTGTNEGAGLTAMENMILELSGSGAVISEDEYGELDDDEAEAFRAVFPGDPFGDAEGDEPIFFVNPSLLGGGGGAETPDDYFSPPARFFVPQAYDRGSEAQSSEVPAEGPEAGMAATADEGEPQIPDLVDAWGSPILAWVADTDSVLRVREAEDFARVSSDDGAALFYWNSNAGFLRSDAYGEDAVDMTAGFNLRDTNRPASLLGAGVVLEDAADPSQHLAALLGSPDHPVEDAINLDDPDATGYTNDEFYPLRGRGEVIIQSAGVDQIPFSVRDPALRQVASGGDILSPDMLDIRYAINFFTGGDTRRKGDNGAPTSIDFAGRFDDILSSGN